MSRHSNDISKRIYKAIGIFGGTQALTILCSIVRTKLVSVLIGPLGMGLFGLYNSAVDMINVLSNMGLRTSCVRDVSLAHSSGDYQRIAEVVRIVRRWAWFLGLIWAIVMIMASPLLSRISFGDTQHSWAFVVLSVSVFAFSVVNSEQAVLQGTQKLRKLAKSMVWGNVIGLLLSIPMFYYLKIDSVVPSIIVYGLSTLVTIMVYRNKDYDGEARTLSMRDTVKGGAEFVKFGICITLSTFATLLVSYVFMAYLNHRSGTATVGLYQAGYALVNRYSELLFSAIAMEFYPRLTGVSASRWRMQTFVAQEANISLYVIMPVVVLFMIFRGVIVDLLYSVEFRAMIPFISWCMVGIVFKGVSWCLAFVILAKGESRVFLFTEGMSAAICLVLNITFYELWGLDGLGVSYTVWYLLYLLMIGAVYVRKFGMKIHKSVLWHTLYGVAVAGAALWGVNKGYYYAVIVLAVVVMTISIVKIRKSVA